ncbi:MAG: hypothetical protein FJZ47_15305 [Candidatus Tectomicrobia bacterium]|uniref:Uncharacterized protein n=1 Tax=Tectimicrobiota bacterium TaxID=2528274 RepID=A0A938B3C1_UNCTE|nr:hypothetical protein [Candidatus Tectomicrobia bacterium]
MTCGAVAGSSSGTLLIQRTIGAIVNQMTPPAPVPEPASVLFVATGVIGLLLGMQRFRVGGKPCVGITCLTPYNFEPRGFAFANGRLLSVPQNTAHELAECGLHGVHQPADPAQAATWFTRAAEDGHALSRCALATLYVRGHGVPKDQGNGVAFV